MAERLNSTLAKVESNESYPGKVGRSYAGLIFIFGWVFAVSRAGRVSGRLPRQVTNCGVALGLAQADRASRTGPGASAAHSR